MLDGVGTTAFTWTAGDQLASEDGPWASDTVSYTYANRLRSGLSVQAPNASAWIQSYAYDSVMRLTNIFSAAGAFGYEYDDNLSDRVSMLRLPGYDSGNNLYIENRYDRLKRLTNTVLHTYSEWISGVPANQHRYCYDLGSQRTQQVFTAGNYVHYTYDGIGQLTAAKGQEADGTTRLHEQFGYGYDAAWNLNQRTNHVLVQTFNVNNLNELATVTNKGTFTVAGTATEPKGGYSSWGDPPGVTNVTVSGTGLSSGAAELYLDGTWARTNATLTNGNNSYTATALDTYGRTSQDSVTVNLPATNTFVYDLNGNLRTNNTRIFDYDDENQLTRVTEPSGWKSEFSYDGKMRRRVRKEYAWSGGTWLKTNEVRYAYDGLLVIQERDANNLPQVTYTRGSDLSGSLQGAGGIGGLLARTDNGLAAVGASAHAYFHCDGNGNVTKLVNTNGIAVAAYQYDPYGNILSLSGPLAEANAYRFSSKEWHQNSGQVYYLYRYYSPSFQRWLNCDPLGDSGSLAYSIARLSTQLKNETRAMLRIHADPLAGRTLVNLNLYEAMGGNPISYTDPFGLDFASCYADCIEQFRDPIGNGIAETCNAALNKAVGDTGRTGIGGKKPHPTTWQNKAGREIARKTGKPAIGQLGKAAGRAAIAVTIFDGFFNLGMFFGCGFGCADELPPAPRFDPAYWPS